MSRTGIQDIGFREEETEGAPRDTVCDLSGTLGFYINSLFVFADKPIVRRIFHSMDFLDLWKQLQRHQKSLIWAKQKRFSYSQQYGFDRKAGN